MRNVVRDGPIILKNQFEDLMDLMEILESVWRTQGRTRGAKILALLSFLKRARVAAGSWGPATLT